MYRAPNRPWRQTSCGDSACGPTLGLHLDSLQPAPILPPSVRDLDSPRSAAEGCDQPPPGFRPGSHLDPHELTPVTDPPNRVSLARTRHPRLAHDFRAARDLTPSSGMFRRGIAVRSPTGYDQECDLPDCIGQRVLKASGEPKSLPNQFVVANTAEPNLPRVLGPASGTRRSGSSAFVIWNDRNIRKHCHPVARGVSAGSARVELARCSALRRRVRPMVIMPVRVMMVTPSHCRLQLSITDHLMTVTGVQRGRQPVRSTLPRRGRCSS